MVIEVKFEKVCNEAIKETCSENCKHSNSVRLEKIRYGQQHGKCGYTDDFRSVTGKNVVCPLTHEFDSYHKQYHHYSQQKASQSTHNSLTSASCRDFRTLSVR